MPFIRTQKLVYNDAGKIVSGSAAIVDVSYVASAEKYKSKQMVRERLGKVIEMYGKRRGLFQSPTRGLVIYDADTDSFSDQVTRDELDALREKGNARVKDDVTTGETERKNEVKTAAEQIGDNEKHLNAVSDIFPESDVHTVFGDTYLLIEIMKKTGIWKVISEVFTNTADKQRILCHILHCLLRDGSKISCEDFVAKSFAVYCVSDIPLHSLKSDTRYFTVMGEDTTKIDFFTSYVKFIREQNETFGSACYVDSTPLPNAIDSPFNALCSHGLDATSVQMRLAMVLDESTLYPVWYDIIPGNILDISTLTTVTKDVEISLDIKLNSYTLDAGYASKELIQNFEMQKEGEPIPEKRYLVRMPAKKGFPHKELYNEMKDFFWKPKYCFLRNGHAYFGKDVRKTVFDKEVQCYVFVDKYNALKGHTKYMSDHPEEYEQFSFKEQAWQQVKYGYFVLMGNYNRTPAQMLDDYFGRTHIECFFKNTKEYLKLLPLCKWKDNTVRGKILSDVIVAIVKQKMMQLRKNTTLSMSSVLGKCQSLMCIRDKKTNKVFVEKPNRQVRECYENFGIPVPQEIDLNSYIRQLYEA